MELLMKSEGVEGALHNQPADSGDGPDEIADAVPPSIRDFAGSLVSARALAAALEIPRLEVDRATAQMEAACTHLSGLACYRQWVDWVAQWTSAFARRAGADAVRVRLSHSRHPACPRFHIDGVRLRLIATLLGPGTQWLRADDVTKLRDGTIDQQPDPALIQQMPQGSLGMFRGSAHQSGVGVVHRSPPDAVDRIVMTLDVAA